MGKVTDVSLVLLPPQFGNAYDLNLVGHNYLFQENHALLIADTELRFLGVHVQRDRYHERLLLGWSSPRHTSYQEEDVRPSRYQF